MVVQAHPDSVKGWFRLAKAREAMGDMDDARKAMYTAAKLQPKNKRVRKELAALTAAVKKSRGAVAKTFKAYEKVGHRQSLLHSASQCQPASQTTPFNTLLPGITR